MNSRDLKRAALLLPHKEREALAESLQLSLEREEPSTPELERQIERTFAEAFAGPFEEWGDEQWASLRRGERKSPSGSGEGAPAGWFA